jgi:hypothetical protein
MLVFEKAPYKVERKEIPSYFTPDNIAKINFYWAWKTLGWPYSGGWAEQPAQLIDIVMTLESEMGKRAKND